jgi:hypothetical protein
VFLKYSRASPISGEYAVRRRTVSGTLEDSEWDSSVCKMEGLDSAEIPGEPVATQAEDAPDALPDWFTSSNIALHIAVRDTVVVPNLSLAQKVLFHMLPAPRALKKKIGRSFSRR